MKGTSVVNSRARLATIASASVLLSVLVGIAPAAATTETQVRDLPSLLVQAPETSSPAYNRDRFEHWIDADGDGCNTRYEVLIDESTTPVTIGDRCSLTGGTWVSPYDGLTTTSPADIEIDHVVALAEAWRSGASAWSDDQRRAFANDLDVPFALTAASSSSNQSKSDKDPAEWLPTNTSFTCEYVTSWALTKYRWSLTVDPAEHAAISNVLRDDCGEQPLVLPAVASAAAAAPTITFTDIAGHVFAKEITWLASSGVSRGWEISPGVFEFRPQARILRGEMAAFLYRLAGSPPYTPPTTSRFIDVSTSYVFYKEISWLADNGISQGWATSNGAEFRPFAGTSRDVMAAFLHRFDGFPSYNPTTASPFRDVPQSNVFYREILWLASKGISTGWDVGYGCKEYRPYQNVTRSEMAAFIYRMVNGGTAPVVGNTCAPPPSPLVQGNVSSGAFCKAELAGWYGYTVGGVLMQCKIIPGDTRLRWRAV